MKKYIVLLLLFSAVCFAQNINEYKYATVPAKFSFLKEENQYNLNLLTKMYLQKYGFETYYNNETAPDDFVNSNCNKIFVDIVNNSNMFTTKLKVVIKDCKNNILISSEEGASREKEYKVAYNEALRMAFDNFSVLKVHKFQPLQKSLEMIGEPITNQMLIKKYNVVATKNGFNLITAESDNKFFQIFKTSSNDVFIGNRDNVSGVLIKKTDNWFFEYYQNDKLVSEKVEVKF